MEEFQIPNNLGKKTLYFKGYDLIKIMIVAGVLMVFFVIDITVTKVPSITDFIIPAIVALSCLYTPYGEPYPLSLFKTLVFAINKHNRLFFTKESKIKYDLVVNNEQLKYQYGINFPKYHYDKTAKNNVIDEFVCCDVYDKDGYRLTKNIKLNLPVIVNKKNKLVFNLPTIPFTRADGTQIQEPLNLSIEAKKSTKKELKAKVNREV